MGIILGVSAIIILILVFGDFFFTTLSFHGYGFISGRLNKLLGSIIIKFKSTFWYTYSGLTHLLINSFFWLSVLILAGWMLFCIEDKMVVDSMTGDPAGLLDRFYFTCYVISTVGLGDFIAGNPASKIIFSMLSFSGFVMLTLNITYLSSVIQAVKQQKILATHIDHFGKDISSISSRLSSGKENIQELDKLREMVIEHVTNHYSFPVIHRFISRNDKRCPVVQCLKLYIALSGFISNTREDIPLEHICKSTAKALNSYIMLDRNLLNKFKNDEEVKNVDTVHKSQIQHLSTEEVERITIILHTIGKGWKNLTAET